MKKKLSILFSVYIAITCLIGVYNYKIAIALSVLFTLVLTVAKIFLALNKAVKKTTWYKNHFTYTDQFVTNSAYRKNLIRNLEIVNVGSNPARYAFFYEHIKGENWSTGTQGLEMDLEILKYRFSLIKKGGIVLLPIVTFSSVSEYLKNKPQYRGPQYYAKYTKVIDMQQLSKQNEYKKMKLWIKYPLLAQPRSIQSFFKDSQSNNRLSITEQNLGYTELILNAESYIDGWKKEFNIKDMEAPLSSFLNNSMNDTALILQEIIDFLTDRELTPVILYPPMSSTLSSMITKQIKETYVYQFIERVNRPNIKFLDYSNEELLQQNDLYMDSLFMNLRGRKEFSQRVLNDLGLLTKY